MDVPGYLTNVSETLVITSAAGTMGPTQSLFGSCMGVIAMVLSNGVLASMHDSTCTPGWSDFQLFTGDVISVYPAHRLRMQAQGGTACVKLQGWIPA